MQSSSNTSFQSGANRHTFSQPFFQSERGRIHSNHRPVVSMVQFGAGGPSAAKLMEMPFKEAVKKVLVLEPILSKKKFKHWSDADKIFHFTGFAGILGCVLDVWMTDRTLRKKGVQDDTRKHLVKQEAWIQVFNESNWLVMWYMWPLMMLGGTKAAVAAMKSKPLRNVIPPEAQEKVKNRLVKAMTHPWERQLLGSVWNAFSFGVIRTWLMQNMFVNMFRDKTGDMKNTYDYDLKQGKADKTASQNKTDKPENLEAAAPASHSLVPSTKVPALVATLDGKSTSDFSYPSPKLDAFNELSRPIDAVTMFPASGMIRLSAGKQYPSAAQLFQSPVPKQFRQYNEL